MGLVVCMGATLKCSFGAAPSTLNVLPPSHVLGPMPVANIGDSAPLVNVLPFGTCSSLANPTVAAATAAALGALTPMPCIPVTPAPWIPSAPPFVTVFGLPVLQNTDKLCCAWGGMIEIVNPAQTKTSVK